MTAFVTVCSIFVGSVILVIVYTISGQLLLAGLPVVAAVVTGSGITRMLVVAEKRPRMHDE